MSSEVLVQSPPEEEGVEVLAVRNPFLSERTRLVVQGGETISEILERLDLPPWASLWVELDGWRVPPAWWPHTRPKRGRRLIVRVVPRGGGGGGDDNKTLRIVLIVVIVIATIVLIALMPYGTPAWVLMAIAAAGSLAVMAVNMLLAPGAPKLGSLAAVSNSQGHPQESPTLSITGTRNTANPYGPIAKIFGRHRIFPALGAVAYTEQVGNDQYFRQLFVVGYGPLDVSDLKIGETPLTSFLGVEVEVRNGYPDDPPMTLYSQDVAEEPLTVALTNAGGWQARVGTQACDELSVDVTYPNGLVQYDTQGNQQQVGVDIFVQYRLVGTETWLNAAGTGLIETYDSRSTQVRVGLRWTPTPTGKPEQYEVRLWRGTPDTNDTLIRDQAVWSALRTIRWAPPITMPGLCQVALRIKATDQLNGVVDQFNCIAQALLPDWDPDTQTWIRRATRSPAAAYREVLQGPGNARPVTDARISLENLQAWAERAAVGGYYYDQVIDFRTTVREQLSTIAAAGLAGFTLIDGKHGVVEDLPQTVPVQHFTPRNSWGFRASKILVDRVHAWKVHWVNPDADWQQDELMVYADGYSALNATKFEVLELLGVTDRDQAWRLGRYHHAAVRLRPESYELDVDIENLVCTRGDLVRVTHDVPKWGYGQARITAVTVNESGEATGISLDDLFPMVTTGAYAVRIRLSDGASLVAPVEALAEATKTVTFVTPQAAPLPEVGDLVLFGELGNESVECIVKQIEHAQDFVAKLTLLDAAPAIHAAAEGPIPPYDPHITLPPVTHRRPPTPVIEKIASDESVLVRGMDGTLQARIVVSLRYMATSAIQPDLLEAQYRPAGSSSPYSALPSQPALGQEVSISGVQDGYSYDARFRTVTLSGLASEWVGFTNYQVVGKSSPPPAPTNLRLIGGVLSWDYVAPQDFSGFKFRRIPGATATWEQGLKMHDGLVTASSFATLPPMFGPWTIMVKAFDTSGNESLGLASLTLDLGTLPVRNAVQTQDEWGLGFPGTIVNGTVNPVSGDLEADQEVTGFWTRDTAAFWSADGNALFWVGPYKEMSYTFEVATGATGGGNTRLLVDVGIQGPFRIEYKKAADLTWLAFPGSVDLENNTTYEVRVTVEAGPTQGVIAKLTAYIDAPDLAETLQNVAIASGTGTRLSLAGTYRAIKTVQLTVVASGVETAIAAVAQDKSATLGPLVRTVDQAGATVAGHVDAVVTGY